MSTNWLATTALLILPPMLAVGQQETPTSQVQRWSGRVKVMVVAAEPTLSAVTSYVNRDLREIRDVIVTDDRPEYRLEIFVKKIADGYAISMIGCANVDTQPIRALLLESIQQPQVRDFVMTLIDGAARVPQHFLELCPPKGLRDAIREAVVKFDADTLQLGRVLWRDLIDMQEKAKHH